MLPYVSSIRRSATDHRKLTSVGEERLDDTRVDRVEEREPSQLASFEKGCEEAEFGHKEVLTEVLIFRQSSIWRG